MRTPDLETAVKARKLRYLGHRLRHPESRATAALFGTFFPGVAEGEEDLLLEAEYQDPTILEQLLATWDETKLPRSYLRYFWGRNTKEARRMWYELQLALRARGAAKYWFPEDQERAAEAETAELRKLKLNKNLEAAAAEIRVQAAFDPQVERSGGFQGLQQVRVAAHNRDSRKLQKMKAEIQDTGEVEVTHQSKGVANKRKPRDRHFYFKYRCKKCEMDFVEGPSKLPVHALAHAKAHGGELLTIWRAPNGDLWSDATTTAGSSRTQAPYAPWRIRNSQFSFVKNIFPVGNLTLAGENATFLRCKWPGCEHVLRVQGGIQSSSVRKKFYNSLRRHETKCPCKSTDGQN
jgi:hypothetical protein